MLATVSSRWFHNTLAASIDRVREVEGGGEALGIQEFVLFLERESEGEEEADILLLLKAFLASLEAKGFVEMDKDSGGADHVIEGIRAVLREAAGELEASLPSPALSGRRKAGEREGLEGLKGVMAWWRGDMCGAW